MKHYLFILIAFATTAVAQTPFNKRYGSNEVESGYSITVTKDGGYAVVGNTLANGAGGNIFLMKLSRDGAIQWQKDIFGVNDDQAYSVYQLSNGNYIIGGKTYSYGSGCGDAFINMLDSAGNMIWSKSYGDVACQHQNSVTVTSTGIAGCGHADGGGGNGWLYEVDFNGEIRWSKKYLNTQDFVSVKQTIDKGFLAIGSGSSISILKTDSLGNPLWFKKYSSLPANTKCYGVDMLKDGSAVLTGMIYLNALGNIADVFLLKIDPNGNTLWFKTYGFTFQEYGRSVKVTKDGGFIIAGYTNSYGHGDWDACLLKTNSNGDLSWAKTYGDVWQDQAVEVQTLENGDFVFVGNSYSANTSKSDSAYVYVVRTDSNGITSCQYKDWLALQQTQNYSPSTQTISAENFGIDSVCNATVSNYQFKERNLCSITTAVQSIEETNSFSIYPNPASNIIHLSNIAEQTQIRITNPLGQTVFQNTCKDGGSLTIDISLLPKGLYFLNGHKFIKE